jgi:radical SAM protein with 4Fe4S-binding SPASM domain
VVSRLISGGCNVLIATNGICIDKKMANELFKTGAYIGLSFETLDPHLHEELTGVPGSHKIKLSAIDFLLDAGFADAGRFDIIVKSLKENRDTLEQLWVWALSKGIHPILDRAIPTGRCESEEPLEGPELFKIMNRLHHIEYQDELKIPFVGNEPCNRLLHGFHITYKGDIYPCGGLQFPELKIGSVSDTTIVDLFNGSLITNECFSLRQKIQGECGSCDERSACMGCRAVAYARTRNLFASDSGCWHYCR